MVVRDAWNSARTLTENSLTITITNAAAVSAKINAASAVISAAAASAAINAASTIISAAAISAEKIREWLLAM